MGVAEEMVLGFLKSFSPDDIRYFIKKDVSLADLAEQASLKEIKIVRALSGLYKPSLSFDFNEVMKWIKQSRPDLYGVFSEDIANREWLKTNLLKFIKYMWYE